MTLLQSPLSNDGPKQGRIPDLLTGVPLFLSPLLFSLAWLLPRSEHCRCGFRIVAGWTARPCRCAEEVPARGIRIPLWLHSWVVLL